MRCLITGRIPILDKRGKVTGYKEFQFTQSGQCDLGAALKRWAEREKFLQSNTKRRKRNETI